MGICTTEKHLSVSVSALQFRNLSVYADMEICKSVPFLGSLAPWHLRQMFHFNKRWQDGIVDSVVKLGHVAHVAHAALTEVHFEKADNGRERHHLEPFFVALNWQGLVFRIAILPLRIPSYPSYQPRYAVAYALKAVLVLFPFLFFLFLFLQPKFPY